MVAMLDRTSPEYLIYSFFIALIAVVLVPVVRKTVQRRHDVGGAPRDSRPVTPPLKDRSDLLGPDYSDVFPPSSRGGLSQLIADAAAAAAATTPTVDAPEFRERLIGWESDFRHCHGSTLLPSHISVGEVRALGDFPDYAVLSGVPPPESYADFVYERAIHRPYRPFRWAYHQTMSLTKLEKDWWLELERSYAETIGFREQLFEKHGKMVLDYLPGVELAAKELMEMALQFYCARYPQFFSLTRNSGENGGGGGDGGYTFHNKLLGTSTVIANHHPLHVLLHNIPEDFAIMQRNPADGKYYFRGGVICSALGWSVASKIGKQLRDIHEPIPDYREKMEFSMDRFFSKMPANKPIQRGSWGLEVDKPLFMPPGDPHEAYRDYQADDLSEERVHLRVDWQTLRRLPLSAAIVFNFKGVFTPLTEIRDEPFVPALLRKVLVEAKPSIMRYKNTWHTEHVALPALDRWAEEQVRRGLVPADWTVGTLKEHPMFPGWEDKWHRRQGF